LGTKSSSNDLKELEEWKGWKVEGKNDDGVLIQQKVSWVNNKRLEEGHSRHRQCWRWARKVQDSLSREAEMASVTMDARKERTRRGVRVSLIARSLTILKLLCKVEGCLSRVVLCRVNGEKAKVEWETWKVNSPTASQGRFRNFIIHQRHSKHVTRISLSR